MSANARRKALLALRAEMNSATAAETDRRKRKQIQKDYEARIAALVEAGRSKREGVEDESDEEASPTETTSKTTVESQGEGDTEFKFVMKQTDVSKSQRKKEKKEQKRRAEQAKLLEQNRQTDLSEFELRDMKSLLDEDGLEIVPIASDGNCLYRALEHQLGLTETLPHHSYRELRGIASKFIIDHKDEFINYLDEDFQSDNDSFLRYAKLLSESDEWGGELEIRLISEALRVPIRVYTRHERIDYVPDHGSVAQQEKEKKTMAPPERLSISFHRHMMASAHYNSLKRCLSK